VTNYSKGSAIVLACTHGHEDVVRHLLQDMPPPGPHYEDSGVVCARVAAMGDKARAEAVLAGRTEREAEAAELDARSDGFYMDDGYALGQVDVRRGLTDSVYGAINGGHHRILRMLLEFARPWTSTQSMYYPSMFELFPGVVRTGDRSDFSLRTLREYCEEQGSPEAVIWVVKEEEDTICVWS
jgi:hypothetical protein